MTSLRYKDKVALVTGGSRGIGKGCVDVFVENGAKVIFCSNDDTEGQDLESKLNSKGPGEALFIYGDVTQESHIKKIVEKTVEKFGRIDCLINNAGTHPLSHTIDEFSAEDFRKLLDLNLINYFLFSKGAITSMTKALAIDEAKYNVRVNSVAPSSIWTPLLDDVLKSVPNPLEAKQMCANSQLLGRIGTIEEVGKACLFLASDATFCTGIELNLTAGAELNYGIKNMRKQKTSAN
ncbi:L-fucose dehydrogenase-like isoform X2 [Mytilus galloprovincialis]|uniref:L-fucose dehydrogenase-like isoform X2 n=1 Tax=Mytilus galloprovincialis TaxID=29158 RepID=UPI003F7C9BD8